MDVKNRKRELVKEFSPMLEKSSPYYKIWVGFLLALIVIGLYALVLQFRKGHEITGMRDNVVWGIYIINFQ